MNEQNINEQETTGGTQMPGFGRMNGRPGFDGSEQPPTLDGSEQPPTLDGSEQPPTLDGSEQPPTLDGSEQPPTFGGMQQQGGFGGRMNGRPGFGGMQQQGGFGSMQHQGNMWGNESFAGEDMLNSNNFASQNFGAPGDLSGIVDTTSADISVNIGEQNNFGNFHQGGVTFGNQGDQGMNFRPSNRMQAR